MNVTNAGAICLGLVLGTAMVQRMPPRALGRWRTWLLFAVTTGAAATTCASVAGTQTLLPMLIAATIGLLVRSQLDPPSTRGATP